MGAHVKEARASAANALLTANLLDALAPKPAEPEVLEPEICDPGIGNGASAPATKTLDQLSIKELKQRLKDANIQVPAGIAEKSELVELLRAQEPASVASPADSLPNASNPEVFTTGLEVD